MSDVADASLADVDLPDLVAQMVDKRHGEVDVSPVTIANECMKILDPDATSVARVYRGCHLHLRHLARGVLARAFDPADRKKHQRDAKAIADLFTLQARYPRSHTADLEDPVYVRREDMTVDDVKYNVARLRAEGRAKIAHADALDAWWGSRVSEEVAARTPIFEPAE